MLCLALWSPRAFADPKDDARRHFVAGLGYAEKKDYQAALDEFLLAQEAWPHPSTLYNIARSYADLGDLDKALEYYRLFADAAPERKEDVAPVIAVLEAQLRQRNAPVAAAPVDLPPAAPAVPAAAPSVEAERLRAIAAELQQLSEELAKAPPPAAPVAAAPAVPAPTPVAPPEALPTLPDQGALLSDAYERVVITASRYGQTPLDSPSTVTILTEEDIRTSGAGSVPELLRRVAGVDVMELSAAEPSVSIRGFNRELANKVLVLVDGRTVYLDTLGTVVWSSLPISLQEIERIEIIRGPGSAVYGANAVTGVINILTRTPGEGRSLLTAAAGDPGIREGTALVTGRAGSTAWRLSAGWDEVGRWSRAADPETQDALVPFFEDQSTSAAVARANGRLDQAFLQKGLASLSAGWSSGRTEVYTLGALGDYGLQFTSAYARGDLGYGPVHARAFYNTMAGPTGPWLQYAGARDLDSHFTNDVVDVELEALGDLKTGPVSHRVNGGLGYRYKATVWDYFADGTPLSEMHLNAFLQEEAGMGPVKLVLSLRGDLERLDEELVALQAEASGAALDATPAPTLSPRGAAIVRVARATSVRVTGGTAFRDPSLLERYLVLDQPTGADGIYVHTVGDAGLLPERILTGEVGVHDESSAIHTADACLYVNKVDRLIGLRDIDLAFSPYDPDANGYSAGETGFRNDPDSYLALGGEAELRLFPVDGLDVYGNLAVERVTRSLDGVTEVDQSTSLLKVNTGVSWRSPWRFDVAGHLSYVSPQAWPLRDYNDAGVLTTTTEEVPARTLLTARLGARPFDDDRLEIAANAWNILQFGRDGFREHPKGQLVGPRIWAEATWQF